MLKFGEIVPLHLQLYDGNEDMTVVVQVISPLQDLVFEGELLHVKNGLYETLQFRMPMVDYVIAMYTVLDGTRISRDYEISTDLFYRDSQTDDIKNFITEAVEHLGTQIDEMSKEEQVLVGNQISEVASDDGFLEGVEIP